MRITHAERVPHPRAFQGCGFEFLRDFFSTFQRNSQ
jgi:hypothetical protein